MLTTKETVEVRKKALQDGSAMCRPELRDAINRLLTVILNPKVSKLELDLAKVKATEYARISIRRRGGQA